MTAFFLRRFGAALVCSLAFAAAGAPLVLAADTDVAPAGADAAPARDEAAQARADADSKKTDPDPGSDTAGGIARDAGAKSESGHATSPAGDAAKGAGDAASDSAKTAGHAASPASDSARTAGHAASPASGAAKTGAGAAKPGAAAGVATTRVQAKEEAEKEGRRHGARSKAADGTLILWDTVSSVWVAAEPKHTYWVDEAFYRFDEGVWLKSKLVKGPWEVTASRFVPEAPRGRHGDPKDAVTATLPSGVEALWDPRLRVFKVAGRKGVFLFDAAFYRYDGGVWLESGSPDGPWTHTSSVGLPTALRRAVTQPEQGARVTLPSGDVLVSEGAPNLFGVEGRPDALYFDGTFYERRDQKWFQSAAVASGWEEVSSQQIPGTVRSNYHKGGKKKDAKRSGKDSDRKKGAARGGKAAGADAAESR